MITVALFSSSETSTLSTAFGFAFGYDLLSDSIALCTPAEQFEHVIPPTATVTVVTVGGGVVGVVWVVGVVVWVVGVV